MRVNWQRSETTSSVLVVPQAHVGARCAACVAAAAAAGESTGLGDGFSLDMDTSPRVGDMTASAAVTAVPLVNYEASAVRGTAPLRTAAHSAAQQRVGDGPLPQPAAPPHLKVCASPHGLQAQHRPVQVVVSMCA